MSFQDTVAANEQLVGMVGMGDAYLATAVALFIEEPDTVALASQGLVDGSGDKKIDLIFLDADAK